MQTLEKKTWKVQFPHFLYFGFHHYKCLSFFRKKIFAKPIICAGEVFEFVWFDTEWPSYENPGLQKKINAAILSEWDSYKTEMAACLFFYVSDAFYVVALLF